MEKENSLQMKDLAGDHCLKNVSISKAQNALAKVSQCPFQVTEAEEATKYSLEYAHKTKQMVAIATKKVVAHKAEMKLALIKSDFTKTEVVGRVKSYKKNHYLTKLIKVYSDLLKQIQEVQPY